VLVCEALLVLLLLVYAGFDDQGRHLMVCQSGSDQEEVNQKGFEVLSKPKEGRPIQNDLGRMRELEVKFQEKIAAQIGQRSEIHLMLCLTCLKKAVYLAELVDVFALLLSAWQVVS